MMNDRKTKSELIKELESSRKKVKKLETLLKKPQHTEQYIAKRKRAAGQLGLHSEIMKNMAEGVILTSISDGTIVYTNPKFEEMFGYDHGELVGKNISVVNAPTAEMNPDKIAKDIQRSLKKTGVWSGKVYNKKKNGAPFWCYANVSTFEHTKYGTVWIGIHTDITEHRLAEETLRESEERYRTLFEKMDEGFCVVEMLYDSDGKAVDYRFVEINPAFEKHTGLQQALGKTIRQMVPNHDAHWFEIYGKVARTGEAIRFKNPAIAMQRYYDVFAFRVGGDGSQKVGILFNDISERKQVEESLRESEIRFHSLYENSTIGLYRTTRDGKIILANPTLVEMLGYSSFEELAARNLEQKRFEPSYERKHFIEKIELNGEVKGLESAWTHRNGSAIYIRESARVIRDSDGKTLYYDGTVEDITERKRAEEELRESEARYRSLFENSIIGISQALPDGRLLCVNTVYSQMYGYKNPEEILTHVSDVGHQLYANPGDREEVLSILKEKGSMAPREMTVKRRDGTRFFVLVGAREIKDSKGNLLYYQAEHVDITERKRMEEALRESEERFRHLFDASPDGIVVIGPDGCITNVNNTQVQMFRYESLTDLIGVHATQLVAMSSRDYSAQILQRRLNGEDIPPVEYELVRKDGTTFYGVTSATILRREDGTVSGYLCTTRDTTERKRTEEELKRKQKMLARTESIAHIGSWEWDIATDTVTWSNELFQIFQRDPREVAPSFAEQTAFYHPDDMVRLQKAVEATLADGTPYTLELRVIRKDGETRVCVARGYPEIVRSGRPVRLFGSLQDITESKLTEKALKESENLYRSLFENMLNGFAYCQMIFKEGRSQDLLYLSVNKAFEKLTGLKNVAGRKITEVIPGIKESNPELLEIYGRVALTGKPESFEDYLEPLKAWLFISVYSPAKGYIIAVFDNITARKREEEEIRKSHEELRMLANHLQNIREEERNHLAREFHDQLGQSMTALKMDLSLLLRMISDEKQDIQRNLVAEELQSMQKLVDETSQLLWTIITELRPQMLDDLGLVATFEWEAQRFESRSGISCEFKSIAGDIQLDSKKSIVLFRIYQEALSNIIRHANATVVKSVLQRNGEMLVLEIKDNGRGISIDEQFKQKPFGLIGMRERALAIGGLLEISGIAGEGTTIIVRLPIGQVATEDSKGH